MSPGVKYLWISALGCFRWVPCIDYSISFVFVQYDTGEELFKKGKKRHDLSNVGENFTVQLVL